MLPCGYVGEFILWNCSKSTKTSAKKGKGETLAWEFWADAIVEFVRKKIADPNDYHKNCKEKVLNRAIKVYLFEQKKLAEIRYGENPLQALQEMTRALTTTSIS